MSKALNNVVKLNNIRNVSEFGAKLDGTTDDLTAFNLAIASITSGAAGEIVVDGVAYLSGVTTLNGRLPTFIFKPGAGICTTSGGAVGGEEARLTWPTRFIRQLTNGPLYNYSANPPDAQSNATRLRYDRITGDAAIVGKTQGVGVRTDYYSWSHGSAFDIAELTIGIWTRLATEDGGQNLTSWKVAVSPDVQGATTRWGQFVAEYNVTNRGSDHGWSARRSTLQNWCGILQLVPSASVFGASGGATSYNSLYHVMLGHSSGNKADGIPAQTWNGLLYEPNAICGDGYGIYASGNDTGVAARNPKAFLGLAQTWKSGLDTQAATLTTTRAVELALAHKVSWLSGGVEKAAIYGSAVGHVLSPTPPEHADDAAAAIGNVPVGGVYRTLSVLKVRVA